MPSLFYYLYRHLFLAFNQFCRTQFDVVIQLVAHHAFIDGENPVDVVFRDRSVRKATFIVVNLEWEIGNENTAKRIAVRRVALKDRHWTLLGASNQHLTTMGVSRLDHLTRQHQILFMANAIEVTSAIGSLGVKRHFVQASSEQGSESVMCRHDKTP